MTLQGTDHDSAGSSALDRPRLCAYFSTGQFTTLRVLQHWTDHDSADTSTSVSINPPTSTFTHHHPGWVGWGYSGSHASRNSKKHPHPTVTINDMTLRTSVPSPPFTTKCTVTVRPTPFSAMRSCLSVHPSNYLHCHVCPSSNPLPCHMWLSVQLPPLPCEALCTSVHPSDSPPVPSVAVCPSVQLPLLPRVALCS